LGDLPRTPGGALADELGQDVLDVGGQRCLGPSAALAEDAQHAAATVVVQVLGPGGQDLADPQPVEHEQADEGVGAGGVGGGGGEQGVDLIAGQPGRHRLVVDGGALHGGERGAGDGTVAGGVAVGAMQG